MVDLMKIMFLPLLPITERDYKYLGLKYFKERGFDISILETHQFIFPGYKETVNIKYAKFENHYEPKTLVELFKIINGLDSNDYIFSIGTNRDGVNLLNQMRPHTKAKFATYISGSIPLTSAPCGLFNKLKRTVAPYIRQLLFNYKIGVFESDLYITGAPKDELVFPFLAGPKTKRVHAHGRDYEMCRNTNSYKHDRPYCVYLDTDVIDASDYAIKVYQTNENKDKERYHEKLVIFLKWIEVNLDVDIIISPHPKSRIYLNKDSFHGFKVVHNASPSLVKSSKFVISEGTSSIMFAIYFDKPMLFFNMKEILFYFQHTCSYSSSLGKNIIAIDDLAILNKKTIEDELQNKHKYKDYKYNYLTYADSDQTKSTYKIIEEALICK